MSFFFKIHRMMFVFQYLFFIFHKLILRKTKNLISLSVIPALIVGISLAITRTKGYGTDD